MIRNFVIIVLMLSFLNMRFYPCFNLYDHQLQAKNAVQVEMPVNHQETIAVGALGFGEAIAGFTLAEVLITLTIIGVIAALVIPSLFQRIQDADLKADFKNNYSTLDQATKRLLMDNGGSLAGVFTGANYGVASDNMRNQYSKYFSYVKTCDFNNVGSASDADGHYYIVSNCWSTYNYELNKSLGTDNSAQYSQAVLNNGAALDFVVFDSNCARTGFLSTNDLCGVVIMDVNGIRGPNQYGRDLFAMYITKTGVVPEGAQTDSRFYNQCNPTATDNSGSGFGCAAYIMQNHDY